MAKENLRVAQAQQQAATAQVDAAQVQNADLQLSYCTIVAPISGRIAQRTVQTGNRVSVGQALMAVVEDCGSQHRRYRESDRQTLSRWLRNGETFASNCEPADHADSWSSGGRSRAIRKRRERRHRQNAGIAAKITKIANRECRGIASNLIADY